MQKIKGFFKKFANYVRSILNDGGIFCLHRSLIMLLLLSVWTVVYQMIAQSFNVLQLYGPILLLNIVPIFLVMCFFYFIIGKISYSFVVTNTLLSVLLLVNHFKIKFRDEPLNPTDFSLGKEAKNIIQNYDITIDGIVLLVILVCAVTFWLVMKNIKNKRPGVIISVIGILITLTLSAGAYNVIYKNTRIYNALLANLGIYHETTVVSSKGLVYSLINNTSVMKYQQPKDYSRERAEEILNKYPQTSLPETTPNVIAVMGEAFTDIQDWGNVSFTDENPYEYINYLRDKGCYGHIFVPGFAGATALSEFEFLTGNNTSAISPSLPTAYKTLITGPTYSIARHFKDIGFEARAMHPGFPWFYNRQNVYLRMGFDSFTSRDDLEGDIPSTGTYANDTVAAEMIINDFNRHLEENPENGYFNFTVTIQSHGPYNENKLVYEKEYVAKTEDMTDSEYYIINNYLGGVKAANDFMKTMYEYINTINEPTVFIYFGDHLPYLDSEEQIFAKLGLDISSDTYEAYENRYTTDYVIIGNKAFLRSTRPQIKGEQELISANYLSVKLFQYMNVPLPQRQSFLNEMMQVSPLLSKKHNGTSGSFENALTEEQNSIISDYKILQYYNIKDYQVQEGVNQ